MDMATAVSGDAGTMDLDMPCGMVCAHIMDIATVIAVDTMVGTTTVGIMVDIMVGITDSHRSM